MLELIAILGTAAAGLFWLVLKLVAKNASREGDRMKKEDDKRKDAENAAAKERKDTAGADDELVRNRLRKRRNL